jgi:hypothetical protein
MFYVLQNESTAALRRVPILLTDAATGTTAQTGVAITNIYPSVNINGGAFAGGAGTVAEAGYGQYYYEFDATEVATLGLAGIHVTAVGCRDYDAICQVAAFNVYSGAGVGITAGDVWSYVIGSGDSADLTLTTAKTAAVDAQSNTATAQIRSNIWDFDIDSAGFSTSPPYAAGYLINAGNGATTAGSQVWNYDISAISGAGLAGTQLNIAASAIGITAGDVWSYATREITGGLANTVTTVTNPVEVSTPAMAGIANTVWSTDVSGYTSPSAGYDLSNASSGVGISAADVWNYTLTSSSQSADATLGNADDQATNAATNTNSPTLEANIWGYATRTLTSGSGITAGDVWSYATRTTTGGVVDTNNDKTGYSLSSTQTFNVTGNVSGSVGSVTNAVDITTNAMSGTAGSVWNYVTRTLTSGSGITAGDVWSYGTRTITGGIADTVTNPVSITTGAMSGVANTVWESTVASHSTNGTFGKNILRADAANKVGDVTLYSSGGVNGVDADMHRIANDTAAATALKNALTGVGASWTGNITGNVTGSVNSVTTDVNVSTTSMSGIANTVWSAGTKAITGGTVDNVTNPVSVTTTSMSGIAQTAWTYSPRTLTSGAGATAGDIWTYNISGITASGTAGAVLNDASVSGSVVTIVNGPYRLTSIAEGTDGRIDILADSVQTIQLNCLDGFGQPFNVTGYAAAVNVYDVSGALAVTYTPTVDFASSGIVSFDIDTDVTGTTGRYTLVVELTAGAEVVQLGPLEILVRPL